MAVLQAEYTLPLRRPFLVVNCPFFLSHWPWRTSSDKLGSVSYHGLDGWIHLFPLRCHTLSLLSMSIFDAPSVHVLPLHTSTCLLDDPFSMSQHGVTLVLLFALTSRRALLSAPLALGHCPYPWVEERNGPEPVSSRSKVLSSSGVFSGSFVAP